MSDWGRSYPPSAINPARFATVVTPNNDTDLAVVARGLSVNVSGDVSVDFADGGSAIVIYMERGSVYPFAVKRVRSTGTAATGIVAYF